MVRWGAACTVLMLMAAPAAAAPLAEDDAGDHEVTVAGVAPLTGVRWNALDMLSVEVTESPQGFDFILEVDELAPPGEEVVLVDGIDWFLHFSYRDADYRINLYRVGNQPISSGYIYGATLDQYDAGAQRWALLEFYQVDVDEEAGTLGVHLPRDHIVGGDGAGAMKDEALVDVHVTAKLFMESFTVSGPTGEVDSPIQGHDRMPDDGMVEIPIQEGIDQTGSAGLHTQAPVRVSNGEATTMLFTLTGENRADEQQLFRLVAKDAPEHWTVTFPSDLVRIDAGDKVELPVLVTTPFNHEHGAFYSMMVEMQSQQDPEAVGRAEIGIRYTKVPQPAGHHDETFIHIDSQGRAYFNTEEDDPGDEGEEARSNSGCSCNGQDIDRFDIPLLPGLLMGLDFDLDRTGTLDIPIHFARPAFGVTVTGEIGVYEGTDGRREGFFSDDNDRVVAQLSRSDPMDFDAGETKQFSLEINGTAFGDYLPYEQDNAMILHLDVSKPSTTASFCCLVEPEATVLPGGRMVLPLNEYHDDVDDYFSSLTGVELYTTAKQEQMANPGKTVVFNATLQNVGQSGGKYQLSLTGNNVEWARVLGPDTVQVAAGERRQLAIAVVVPADASDGEQADVALHAASVDDDNVRTLIRFLARVDEDADHPDASDLAASLDDSLADDKKSPMPVVAALAALAAAAVLRARRRH